MSNIIFIIASVLYLWMSVQDLIYQQHSENVPTDLLEEYNNCLGTTFRHGHARDCINSTQGIRDWYPTQG